MTARERDLARLVWSGRTIDDVATLLLLAEDTAQVRWRPVGDRPNNIGTIGMASDPGLAMVERITNMFDALLELGHALHPDVAAGSPRDAARLYYGLPPKGLCGMPNGDRRRVAEHMVVSLEESGTDTKPTVVVRDHGIGETAARLPRTLLSLNESNKVGKPWTMGTYGQGGSVTFGFCHATMIVSRRHGASLDGEPDRVAWTVVKKRFDEGKKLPNYEYLVASDGTVMSLPPDLFPDLPQGTQIVHVAYDLQISGPFTTNPFRFFNAALSDPVLPYLLTGNRGREADYYSRVMVGNTTRLDSVDRARGDIDVAHCDRIRIELGDAGTAEARFWVLRRPEKSSHASDVTDFYVQAREAVSMTVNGQRHDYEERSWLRRHASLPFLYKNVIVQIDATELSGEAKAELFASTRERGRTSAVRTRLYDALAYALRHDPNLRILDAEQKERLLRKSTAAASEKVRRRLASFVRSRLRNRSSGGRGRIPGTKSNGRSGIHATRFRRGPSVEPRDTSDTHLPDHPTYLKFLRSLIEVRQARKAHVMVEVDAKNGYLPDHDDSLAITVEGPDPSAIRVIGRSTLLGGKCQWVLEVLPDAPLGDYVLLAELDTPGGPLADGVGVLVKARSDSEVGESLGQDPARGPEVRWVTRDQFDEFGFTSATVGEVLSNDGEEATVILVNRHFEYLEKALRGHNLTADQIQVRAERYQYPVACGLWLQDHHVQEIAERGARPTDDYLSEEMRRLAEAVLAAIDPDVEVAAEMQDAA